MRAVALVALATVAALPSHAAGAGLCGSDPAARLTPCELEVAGGEDAWRPDSLFDLAWRNPPQGGEPPVVAVHYRALDAAMQVVLAEKRIEGAAEGVEQVLVPLAPGVYTAEVWLEDAAGALGQPASVLLRVDSTRPGHVDPLPGPDWIGRPDFPYPLYLSHPAGSPPLSGIRGYAVAVDRDSDSDPCAAADRCSETETVLRGGVEEDTLWLTGLLEGTSYVHAVAVSGSGMKSAVAGHAALHVDTTAPETALHGAPNSWTSQPVSLVATASDAASGVSAAGPAGPFTAIRIDGGAPVVAAGASVRASVIAPGLHTVAHYARDAAGNVDDGHGASSPPATATVRIDPEPPRVAFSGAQDPRDPEAIAARVIDSLSGPARARGRIAVRRAGSNERFAPLPTAVDGSRLLARWDSGAYPPGQYEFQATGFDVAGNESATLLRANGSRMTLSAPLRGSTDLRLRLEGRHSLRPLPFGEGAMLRGQLIGGRRAALAGMTVRVIESFEPASAREERVSTLRTDGGGGFALRLSPGPSREVVASFAGTRSYGRSQSPPVELEVRGGVRMRASATVATVGGRPVVFAGRVAGAIPPGGKYVQLQFRLPGGTWTEFRTIGTDPSGRFRHAYRFSDDDSRGVRFQFRAYATAQDDWPYEPAGSRPVVVRGR